VRVEYPMSLLFPIQYNFSTINEKQDSFRLHIIDFEIFVWVEFSVYPIYDFWSNIEHGQGLFLTNKEKKLMT
jgi:hypothetical protein